MTADTQPPRPTLRIVRGDPSDEEIAALVAVLSAARPAGRPKPKPPAVGRWADRRWQLRGPLRPGPGAWRASARLHG